MYLSLNSMPRWQKCLLRYFFKNGFIMKWTNEEIDYIKKNFDRSSYRELADGLGRTRLSVKCKCYNLGLKKMMGNPDLKELGKPYRFKKGHISHNKGQKVSKRVYNLMKPTMFKKGNLPHNTKPVGTISIRKDSDHRGYKYIKIAVHKWVLLHRHIWTEAHGDIPADCILRFKDGDTHNCDLDNLELVTKEKNMILNSIQNYPENIICAIRASHKLDRTIELITKSENQREEEHSPQ